jgi:hypothetical protein
MIPLPLGPIYTNGWPNMAGDPLIVRPRTKCGIGQSVRGQSLRFRAFSGELNLWLGITGRRPLAGPAEIHKERGDFALRGDGWGCLELEVIRQASRSAANRFGDDDDARFRG